MIPWWSILVSFSMGSLLSLAGVFLGALFVFRTKREPYEPFLKIKPEKGDAFNLADDTDAADMFTDMVAPKPESDSGVPIPNVVNLMNNRARRQMAGDDSGVQDET